MVQLAYLTGCSVCVLSYTKYSAKFARVVPMQISNRAMGNFQIKYANFLRE